MNLSRLKIRLGRPLRGFVLAAALLGVSGSVAADNPSHAVSLQFLHPIATSPNPETDTAVRLSLLWGRSARVSILDLSLVAAATSGDTRGLQLVGLYGGVGGDLRGVGVTAGVHLVQHDVRGVQWSGLASWTGGEVSGFQFSSFMNYAGEGVRGVQLSGLLNVNDGPGSFLQLASVANVNVGSYHGLQLAGFVNHANSEFSGFQVATLNYADTANGAQIGLINISRDMSGLQLGVVNASKSLDGVPVGLFNFSDDSNSDWLVFASNLSLANLGFRTEVGGWTSIVSAGYGDVQGSQEEAGTLAWNYGRRIIGDREKALGVDIGWIHIMPHSSEDPDVNDQLHGALQARLTGDLTLSGGFGLWAAVGASVVIDSYRSGAQSETEPLFAGGVVLR